MADETNKTPSADEIVDNMAAELGVENESVPEPDESADDMMAGLGGIFDVPGGSKKKKKKKKAEPKAEAKAEPAEEAKEASKPEAAPAAEQKAEKKPEKKEEKKAEKTSKGADLAGVAGVFKPDSADDDVDLSSIKGGSDYLSDDDLGDFVPKQKNRLVPVLVAIIVLLGGGLIAVVLSGDGRMEALKMVLQGNYREYKQAEKARIEEEHRQAQLAALDLFGNLHITGDPLYANIKLNGQTHYGQTSSGAWRELQITPTTVFQNLKIKESQHIEVTAPGFQPFTFTLTEGMWQENPGSTDYQYSITANLQPQSPRHFEEFSARMEGDVENEYHGTINIITLPSGARVTINNRVALDKDGNELRTPINGLDTFWTKDEETGKLEERKIQMDTPPDRGNKIELELPDKEDYPKYVNALQRRMWTCNFKDEKDIKRLPKDAPLQQHCDYTWTLELDFNGLKRYIEEREAEMERIQKQHEQLKAGSKPEAEKEEG